MYYSIAEKIIENNISDVEEKYRDMTWFNKEEFELEIHNLINIFGLKIGPAELTEMAITTIKNKKNEK
ncbi:MAG: hypothetical protein ACRC42_02990 [Mycoplasma sp.]